jgi:hypothetical protein
MTEDPVHRPLPIELIDDQPDDLPDLLVRVQGDLSGGVIQKSGDAGRRGL